MPACQGAHYSPCYTYIRLKLVSLLTWRSSLRMPVAGSHNTAQERDIRVDDTRMDTLSPPNDQPLIMPNLLFLLAGHSASQCGTCVNKVYSRGTVYMWQM